MIYLYSVTSINNDRGKRQESEKQGETSAIVRLQVRKTTKTKKKMAICPILVKEIHVARFQ
jgi:hypothetical protein